MEIQFENYKIREYKENDADSLTQYANNKNVSINLRDGFPYPYHKEDAKKYIQMVSEPEIKTSFAITKDNLVIGSIGFVLGKDVHRYTAELGYWLAEPFWNKGIMTHAVQHMVQYAFETHNLIRVYAEPYSSNPGSMRVLKKAGFEREGLLRASVFKDGKVLDQVLYAKINTRGPHPT